MPEDLWETHGGARRVQRTVNGHGDAMLLHTWKQRLCKLQSAAVSPADRGPEQSEVLNEPPAEADLAQDGDGRGTLRSSVEG